MTYTTALLETGAKQVAHKGGKPNKQLPHLDGRTKASVRFKHLVAALTAELAERGHPPSVREAALVKQAAAAIVASEQLQGLVLAGTATDAERADVARLAHVVIRCLNMIGLDRKSPSNAPDLNTYLDGERGA